MIRHYLIGALRSFRRYPASTAIKLLALSLGLACLLTAHVIGDYLRQADRFWPKADRIHAVAQQVALPGGGWEDFIMPTAAPAVAKYLRADFPELAAVARLFSSGVPVSAGDREDQFSLGGADPDFFRIFDLDMAAGEATLDPGRVLISQAVAETLFGGEPAVGRTLRVGEETELTVAGVFEPIPESSYLQPDLLVGIGVADAAVFGGMGLSERDEFVSFTLFSTFVLTPEGGALTGAALQGRMADFAARHAAPGQPDVRFQVAPITELKRLQFSRSAGAGFDQPIVAALYMLGALALALGCVNFASLSAAAAAGRAHEIGLRKAVGAARWQIAVQTFVESAMLAALALILVMPLAALLARTLASQYSLDIAIPGADRLDYWLSVLAIAALAAVLAGLYPALALARLRPIAALKSDLRRGRSPARAAMVGAQFAVSAALLTALAVMAMQSRALHREAARPGQDPIVFLQTPFWQLARDQAQGATATEDRAADLRDRLLANPSVTGVAYGQSEPFALNLQNSQVYASSLEAAAPRAAGHQRAVSADYLPLTGARLLAGRHFTAEEGPARPFPAIVTESMARAMGYSPQEAVGQPIYQVQARNIVRNSQEPPRDPAPGTIIGVVDQAPLELRARGPGNFVYFPSISPTGQALMRLSRDDVAGGLAHIARVWAERFPDAEAEPRFLDENLEENFRSYARANRMFAGLSAVAVAIAAMGLFGLASFAARRRVQEIGVRKTLGASTGRVTAMMLWDFSKPVLIANLIAWPAAYVAARAYLNQFVTRIDLGPAPFLIALAGTLAIAWVAVGGQAWRAARVKPATVLKHE